MINGNWEAIGLTTMDSEQKEEVFKEIESDFSGINKDSLKTLIAGDKVTFNTYKPK